MIIQSNSKGNAVLHLDSVLVDIGVGWNKLAPYKDKIQMVLLTHEHKDHINLKTLLRLQEHNPNLIVACGKHMLEHIPNVKNVYTLEIGKWYRFGNVDISPVHLYHDVPNYGYRIVGGNQKIFHATDTSHLQGITAINYTTYAIEHNYCELVADEVTSNPGGYEHIYRSIETHLSEQQAQQFIENNSNGNHRVMKLHMSAKYSSKVACITADSYWQKLDWSDRD